MSKPSSPKPEREDEKIRRKKIGNQLRQLYDDVTSEPVPDDFMRLLEEADDSQEGQSQ